MTGNDKNMAGPKTGDKAGQQGAPPKDAKKSSAPESNQPNPNDTGNGGQKYK